MLCPWARHFTPRKYWLITQEAVAPSRHDWKIVDWDVKPQHKKKKKKKKKYLLHVHVFCLLERCCIPLVNLVKEVHRQISVNQDRLLLTVLLVSTIALVWRWGGSGGSLGTWVGKHVHPETWMKGYFFGVGWVIQIKFSKKCKKGYLFHKNFDKMFTKRVFFTVCHSKRGMNFQLRDHSIRLVFHTCRTHMLNQEKSELHSPHQIASVRRYPNKQAGLHRPSVRHTLQMSSQKPLGQLKPNFMWSLSGIGEWKCWNDPSVESPWTVRKSMDTVHWVYGQCPLSPWTLSTQSMDNVHWDHGHWPWTMSTESMDSVHSVHGLFPWVFPTFYLVKNYSNPTNLNAVHSACHLYFMTYNVFMSISTDRRTVSRPSA